MLNRLMNTFTSVANGMDQNDYLLLAACTILAGFICLKGFGSRTDY